MMVTRLKHEGIFMKTRKNLVAASFLLILIAFSSIGAAHAIEVTGTVSVQQVPSGLAYDPAKNEVFVVNTNAGTVSVISDSNNSVVATIPLGNPVPIGVATWIAYDSGTGELFVSLSFARNGKVAVISDSSNIVVDTITVGGEPEGVAYDPGKGEIFVANALSDVVSVISDKTDAVVANVTTEYGTSAIAYGRGEVFAANIPPNNRSNPTAESDTVSVISDSNNTVVANITVGNSPQSVAYDAGKNEMFVANLDSETISVISDKSNSVIKTLSVGNYPYMIAYDQPNGELFVTCSNGTGLVDPNSLVGTVSVISDNSNTVTANITLGGPRSSGAGVVYDSAKSEVFIADSFLGTVSVISDVAIITSVSPTPTVSEFSVQTLVLVTAVVAVVSVAFTVVSRRLRRFSC